MRRRRRTRLTRRGRWTVAFVVGWVLLILAAVAIRNQHRGPTAAEICASPPAVMTRDGVTLTSDAMTAFRTAERLAGRTIAVVQSYRTCAQQRLACIRICGDGNGCPGTCAPPGLSWHNRGAAVDLTSSEVEDPRIVSAMNEAGWCESVPENDPGHFSFGGCH